MLFGGSGGIGVVHSLGQVIDNIDVQRATGRAAVGIRGRDGEVLREAVGAVAVGVALIVQQGVAVADHARGRVVAGDGQGIAQGRGDRLREARRHATADHADAADAQGLQAIRRADRESAALGQGARVRRAAIGQVLLVDGQFATVHVQPAQGHRVVEVADVEGQGRGAGVAVGILQGVGEGLHPIATAVQVLEVRVVGVEGVGVGTVRRQHQGAVGANEGTGHHRTAGDTVRSLDVIAQHIAAEFHLLLGGGGGIAVVYGPWHIVADDHVQGPAGHVAIRIADQHREMLVQRVGTRAVRVMLGAGQGVAVAHHAGGRVVAGNGQHIAEPGDDGLPDARDHARRDHIDATDTEVEHAVGSHHRETAGLCQRRRVAGRALGQVGLVQGQFGRADLQASEADRIVDHRRIGWERPVIVAIEAAKLEVGQQGEAIESHGGETDGGIHTGAHFSQYHETVASAERPRNA